MSTDARAKANSQLARISLPRISGVMRVGERQLHYANDQYNMLDQRLLQMARDERAYNTDLDTESDWWMNVAVFRVINTKNAQDVRYFSAGNTPTISRITSSESAGIHSEVHIIQQIQSIRGSLTPNHTVDQIFSERIPCYYCQPQLCQVGSRCRGALVFFAIRKKCNEDRTKTQSLRRQYGL